MSKYGTANFEELLKPELKITMAVLNEVAWGEVTEGQRDKLLIRLGNTPLLPSTVRTKWKLAHPDSSVTIDQLKTVDMDANAEFQLLRKNGEFSPEGWFLYFWKEAKGYIANAAGGDRAALDEMARTLFTQENGVIKSAPAVRKNQGANADPDFQAWLGQDLVHATNFGRWLEILLKLGFKPFVANKDELMERKVPANLNPSADLACADNVSQAKEFLSTPFTWRADTRSLALVADEGGFNTKADPSKGYSASHGLREVWNPFSKSEINKYYWFRKASNDNCKYTVVSVGLESNWKKVISFPRLCDLHGWPADLFTRSARAIRPFSSLTAADQKKVGEWFSWGWMLPAQCMVDGKLSSEPVLLPAVRTYLYLLILGGVVINTNAIQGKGDSFPEVGVRSLPLKHIYGAIEVVRFHHGADDGAGYTAFVVSAQTVKNQGRTSRFEQTEKRLEAAFNDIGKQIGALNLRWAADGCAVVEPEYRLLEKRLQVIGFNRSAKPLQCSILW
jgi:hypothetical protein